MKTKIKLRKYLSLAISACLVSTLLPPGATAQSLRTWNGGGSDNNWSTSANWVGATAPASGDVLTFAGTNQRTNVNDLTSQVVGGVTFSSPLWHITGNPVTMQINKGFTNTQAGSVVWDLDTTLGAANGTVWVRLGNGSASLVFPKVISGAASRILRKEAGANATGRLSLLNPTNSFLGAVNLGSGPSEFMTIANAGQPSSLGAATSVSAATITVGSTSTAFGTDSSYIGNTDGETDRIINFQGRSTINFNNNSPSNNLTFNGNWTFTPSTTPPRLILGGSSTGTNTVNGTLTQTATTLPFGLDVNGPTTWMFNGANSLLGDVRFMSGKHYLGISSSITATNLLIQPGAVLDVTTIPTGLAIGTTSGQILRAGRTSDYNTDLIGSLDLGFFGTLNLGGIGTPATFKMTGNLKTLLGTIVLDLSDNPAGTNDLLEIGGDLDVTTGATLNINPYLGNLASGIPYTLIKYSGSLIGSSSLTVPPPSRTLTATVSTSTPNEVRVTFNPSGQSAANLIWQGYNPNWDVNLSQAWLNLGASDKFQQLDSVTFDDTGVFYDVNLAGVVAPSAVSVDTTNTYTFLGLGSISGGSSMVISKKGTGTLKIMTPNILSGPLQVSSGTLLGGSSTALGTGPITLGDQTTGTNNVSLQLNSAALSRNPLIITNPGPGTVTLARESGGSVTFAGPLTVTRDLILSNPGPWAAGNRLYISGPISGTGNLTVVGGGYHTWNPTTTNAFTGDVAIRDTGTMLQIDSGMGLPATCNVDVGEGAILQPYGNLAINNLTGTGYVQGVSGTFTLTVGAANGDSLFSGSMRHNTQGGTAGVLRLRKAGTGKLTLIGDSSNSTGGTIVAGGVLAVNNLVGYGLGTGSLVVEPEGTLAGNGSVFTDLNNATIDGKISVGNDEDATGQVFTITNNAALLLNGTLQLDVFSGAGAGDNTALAGAADMLKADCAVTLSGATLTVANPKSLTSWSIGDKWKIINWASAPAGTFSTVNLPALGAGLGWDLSELYSSGVIAIAAQAVRPVITAGFTSGALTLTWSGNGTLQCAPEAIGTYTNVPGATSPFVITNFVSPREFYRISQ